MSDQVERPPWTYVGAYALCVDNDNRVLLCRVGPGYDASGKWTLPGGGLEFGEAPEAAVIRELHEETGLTGEVEDVALVHSGTGPPGEERGVKYGPYHAIRIVFRVAVTGGELADELDGSTDAAAWFTREAAAALPLVGLVQSALQHFDGE